QLQSRRGDRVGQLLDLLGRVPGRPQLTLARVDGCEVGEHPALAIDGLAAARDGDPFAEVAYGLGVLAHAIGRRGEVVEGGGDVRFRTDGPRQGQRLLEPAVRLFDRAAHASEAGEVAVGA